MPPHIHLGRAHCCGVGGRQRWGSPSGRDWATCSEPQWELSHCQHETQSLGWVEVFRVADGDVERGASEVRFQIGRRWFLVWVVGGRLG